MIQTPNRARRTTLRFAALAALQAGLVGAAAGQTIYAEAWTGSGWTPLPGFADAAAGQAGLPSGSDVTIDLSGPATIRVYADLPDQTDVGVITVTAPPGVFPNVQVSRGPTPNFSNAPAAGQPAFRSVGGVIATTSVVVLSAETLTGLGMTARQALRIDLSGDLDGPVLHRGEPNGSGVREIHSISIGGSVTDRAPIVAVDGRVNLVTVVGDVRATLAAQHGGFGQILIGGDFAPSAAERITRADLHAWSGDGEYFALERLEVGGVIGSPGAPSQITTGGPLLRIEADAIHADINTMLDPTDLGFFGGMAARNGDFTGSIYARTLTSFGFHPDATCAIEINGDLDAFVYLENGTRNEHADGPEIDIAGRILPNAVLSLATMIFSDPSLPGAQIRVGDPQGLEGQIIAGNERSVSFEGPNSIVIGDQNGFVVTPGSKHYLTTADQLGGGAVGIAPFNFHQRECFPEHNETLTLGQGQRLENAIVRLYGPAFAEADTDLFAVEHLAPGAQIWADRSADFVVAVSDDEAEATRRIDITGIAGAHYEPGAWRIRPASDSLRCAFVRDTPSIRFDSEYDDNTYRFIVEGGGCGDQPGPGGLTDTGSNGTRLSDIDDSISHDNDDGDNGCP